MEKNNQPRKLDSAKLASIDILKLNNKVVLMRPAYKIAKDSTIQYRRKVLRKMVNRNSRRAEDKLEQYKLRVERIQEEINIMKQIRPNNAIKYALANTSTYSEVLSQPNITLETKCLAKIADHPKMKEVVAKFRKKHSDWKALAEFLLNHIPRRFHRNKYMDEQRKMRINFKVGNQLVKSYIKSKVGTDHTLTEQNTDTKLSVQEKITKQFQEDKEIPAKKTTTNNRNELSDESEDSDLEDSLNIDKDASEDNSEDEKSEVGSDGEVCAEPYIKQEKKSVSKVQRYIKKEKESTSEESIREEVESESEVSNEPYIKQEKKSVSKVQPYIKKEKESTSEESIKEEVESESEVSNELYIKQEKKSVSKVQPYIKKEKESTSEESIKEEVESESEVSNEESEHNKSESKSDTKVKGEMVVKKLKIDAFTDSEDIEVPAFLVCQEDRATTVQHKKSKDSFFMFGDGEEDNENSNDNTSSNGNGSEMDNDDDNEVNTTRKNTLKSTFVGSLNDGSSRGWGQFNRFGHDRGPFQNFERRGNEHFTDKFSRDHQKAPREFQRSGQRGQGYRSFDNRENKIGQRGQGYRSFDNRGNKFGQRGQGYRSFDNRENKFGQRGRNISRSFSNREFQGSGHRGRGYNQSFNGGEVHGYGRSEGGYQRSFGDRQNYSGFQGQRKEYPKSSTEFKDSSKRSDKIHPSWEASKKRKQQQATINTFQGKKIKFDD